jgi:hypothetical protein
MYAPNPSGSEESRSALPGVSHDVVVVTLDVGGWTAPTTTEEEEDDDEDDAEPSSSG